MYDPFKQRLPSSQSVILVGASRISHKTETARLRSRRAKMHEDDKRLV